MNYERWTGLTTYIENYPIREKRKKVMLDFLKTIKKGKFLDVGFYPGDVLIKAEKIGFQCYGLDVIKENIQKTRKQNPTLNLKLCDLNKKMPFKSNFFDVVWAGDIIEHVYDTIKLFSELNRVIKPGGYLVVSTPYHGFLKMLAIILVDLHLHFHPEHYHIRYYTNKNLRMMLKKYGFKVEKEHYLGRIRPVANNMLFVARKVKKLNLKEIPDMFR